MGFVFPPPSDSWSDGFHNIYADISISAKLQYSCTNMETGGIEGPLQICLVVDHIDRKNKKDSDCTKSDHCLEKSKFPIPKIVVNFGSKFGGDRRKAEIEITAI